MTADILNFCVCVCVCAIFQIVATHSFGRKTARWPSSIICLMCLPIMRLCCGGKLWSSPNFKRSFFLEELGRALVSPYVKSRQYGPRTPASLLLLRKLQEDDEEAAGPFTAGPSTADPSTVGLSLSSSSAKRKRCPRCLARNAKILFAKDTAF